MKKNVLLILSALLIACVSTNANAGAFFGLRGGAEKIEVDSDKKASEDINSSENDFMFGGFIGYHYSFFRLEAEYMYHSERKFDDKLEVETQTIMGNLYFSPPIKIILKPYLMAGVGAALHSTEIGKKDDSNTDLAWHIGAGLELEFTENVFLEAGVRYVQMGEAEVKNSTYELKGFNYFGGLRFEY